MKLINIERQIIKLHEAATARAHEAVRAALECGKLLILARKTIPEKEWTAWVEKIGLARTTAWRYERLAKDVAKGRVKYLLEQGASLVDLYREFDLVKPLEGGGYRSDAYQRRKLSEQLQFDFEYEEFDQHITALIKARNVEELSSKTLTLALQKIDAARERVVAVLKDKEAVELDPGNAHFISLQP